MSNQIYMRIGKPDRYKPFKEDKPMHPILYFIVKWSIVIVLLYFFLDDIIRFIFNLF